MDISAGSKEHQRRQMCMRWLHTRPWLSVSLSLLVTEDCTCNPVRVHSSISVSMAHICGVTDLFFSEAYRNSRRLTIIYWERHRAEEGHQTNSRISVRCSVREDTGGALAEPCKVTFSWCPVCIFLTRNTEHVWQPWPGRTSTWKACHYPCQSPQISITTSTVWGFHDHFKTILFPTFSLSTLINVSMTWT